MGSLFDDEDDDEEFDLAKIEARHERMEAEALLDEEERRLAERIEREQAQEAQKVLEISEISEVPEASIEEGEVGEEARIERLVPEKNAEDLDAPEEHIDGIYPASDWEAIVEAVLFTMGNSVPLAQLAMAIDQSEAIAKRVVRNLQRRYQQENRGMQILELENAYQMSTRAKYYENLIRVASAPKKHVLSDVLLETLSIVAYRQPVTKIEIGRIRGVSSDHAVNRLVEYGLIYEAGRLDAPGRPALFATTEEFLRRFGVGTITDLPTMNPEQKEEIIQEVEEELQQKDNQEKSQEEPENEVE
ncbi:SMC-Scp complex subunit ScpB [Brotaphodocola sp.]|uniref:SMC-Scp complex subunit ScpB n=1 Tax=Brotaphodocola sp. TaxID=3073577 RepID=UPI003D7D4BA3